MYLISFVHEYGCPWPPKMLEKCIGTYKASVDVLAHLRQLGCPA